MITSLKYLSDTQLLSSAKSIVAKEREVLIEVLHHLKEIDSRKLYLEIGYPSLWAYCTDELGYAEGSAQRRIEAMRAMREIPLLESKIESGKLSLSNIAKVQSAWRRLSRDAAAAAVENILSVGACVHPPTLQDQNEQLSNSQPSKLDIFEKLENKSQKEADLLIANYLPESVAKKETVKVKSAETLELKLTVSKELMAKIEKVKQLNSHKHPHLTFTEALELMADFMLAKKDLAAAPQSLQDRFESNHHGKHVGVRTNTIPLSTRKMVWRDAGGACEYISPATHRRCGGRYQLEIEHVKPQAFGGGHERENLKLYCRAHNRMTARQATLLV